VLTPLLFAPRLKDKIWGGSKLKTLFNKPATSNMLGESWELSGYEGDESVVVNGPLAGNNLSELIEVYMGDLVGDKVFDQHGHSFPLLFKLIDANENLSIQVHPGDEIASDRHHSYGKTEMWYVVDADPGAELIIGFKDDCSRDAYLDALDAGTVEELLQHVPVEKGDVFFIPAGLVHAIGKGVVVAEIQQSSDVTYRIFDYNRKDAEGNERELHTDEALDVIDFTAARMPKTDYKAQLNTLTPLVNCEYFNTAIIKFNEPLHRNYGNIDSFVVYMCLEGGLELVAENESMKVAAGDTVLVPALIDEVQLLPEGETVLLEVFVPEA
jgi:mannose-6-phosphate isomerase